MQQHFTPQGIKLNIGSFGGRRIGFANRRRGRPTLRPARPAPAQRNQASESILELKTGRKRNKESKRIDVRESQLLSVPNTKRTPYMRGSYTLPEFVLKNQGYSYSIWRNDFGAKNGAQAKQRVEAY